MSEQQPHTHNTPTLQPGIAIATLPHGAEGLWEQSLVTITTAPTNTILKSTCILSVDTLMDGESS